VGYRRGQRYDWGVTATGLYREQLWVI